MATSSRRTKWAPSDRRRYEADEAVAVASATTFLDALACEGSFTRALEDWRRAAPGPAGLREFALVGLLARFHLPHELAPWARQVAVNGVSDHNAAKPFLDRYARASFQVNTQWIGWPATTAGHCIQRVEVSFPKSWSKTRALAYIEDQLDSMLRVRAIPRARAGRPQEPVTAEQDAAKLLEFDRLVMTGALPVRGEGPPFKRASWSSALGTWLGRAWPHRASTVLRLGMPVLRASGRTLTSLACRRGAS